ncbi:MAG TPA: membrane protein insertase YidC [Saprospiraceae bacterium]|nr:membrane protein insertase YidC [Saprospiraceae bacterium]
MEKNHIIGFILIFATLFVFSWFSKPSEAELARRKAEIDSLNRVESLENIDTSKIEVNTAKLNQPQVLPDSIQQLNLKVQFGNFSPSGVGNEELVILENEKLKLTFSSKGAKLVDALIKDYYVVHDEAPDHKEVKELLHLQNNTANKWNFSIKKGIGNEIISSENLYFKPEKSGNSVRFVAVDVLGNEIVQSYSLKPDSYEIEYNLIGSQASLFADNKVNYYWENHLNRLEKNAQFEQRYSTVYFKEANEDPSYCSCTGDDVEKLDDNLKLDWISNSNQFFNSTLMANSSAFEDAELETVMTNLEQDSTLKVLKSSFSMPLDAKNALSMKWYIGPNNYETLLAFNNELEYIIPFGNSVFGSINRYVIRPFFNFISNFTHSKGLAIIVLIFIIKMLLYPLLYKMLHSQAKMGALKPEIAKLKDKYKDDNQKVQMETMKLYQEFKVSPLGGCLPMILQMPIWYALFRFFPASITFRQEPFLWASDLSSYDVWFWLPTNVPFMGDHISLFTVLWAVSTLLYTYYNSQNMDYSSNPAMKYVQYFMPVMFLAFFNNYASGLTCYMFFSNMINVAQTIITKNFIFDDDKIREELHLQKAKPRKKSSFTARLEEAMKQQQQIAQQQKDNKKKKK